MSGPTDATEANGAGPAPLLPPTVRAQVQRIFDGIARRLLDEQLAAAGLRREE
jgi:hypothetical protein